MDYTPKLTGAAVLNEAVERLDDHLPLTAHGYVCSNQDLWRILLGCAGYFSSSAPIQYH